MALQCDLRYVTADAKLGIVQNRRGINPDLRSHWTLPRLVGHGRATELLLTGRMFSGADAAEWGLALEALPIGRGRARPGAGGGAGHRGQRGPPVGGGQQGDPLALPGPGRRRGRRLGAGRPRRPHGQSPDTTEGVMAWVEKRDPQWQGTLADGWPRNLTP